MEPLRLLQFWHIPSDKNTAACGDSDSDATSSPSETTTTTTTTTTNDKDHHSVETDDEDSFFDLDFTVPLKKKQKDFNPNDKVSARKALPKPRVRLHVLLKNAEESEKKTEASEDVPIFSLLDIGNSPAGKFRKQRSENATRRFPKVVIQKYLKLINPFYSRASKKAHTQTVKSANEVSKKTTPFSSPRKQVVEKQRIRVAREHLGKSHSAAASRVRSVPARRDDSLLLQHDGIQSAILHCKRSYNSSAEFSVLSRSASGPGPYPSEKASVLIPSRNSTEEVKTRTSI